jgi:hypothetical protein
LWIIGVLQNGCWAYFGKKEMGKRIDLSAFAVSEKNMGPTPILQNSRTMDY